MKNFFNKRNIIIVIFVLIIFAIFLIALLTPKNKVELENDMPNEFYKWICEIDNKDIVEVKKNKVSVKTDIYAKEYFVFKGKKKGKTKVVFKLQNKQSKSYDDVKIYIIEVDKNLRVKIIEYGKNK